MRNLTDAEIQQAIIWIRQRKIDAELALQEWYDSQENDYNKNQEYVEKTIERLDAARANAKGNRIIPALSDRTLDSWRDLTGIVLTHIVGEGYEISDRRAYAEQLEANKSFKVSDTGRRRISEWVEQTIAQWN